jgi:hypothetical protein
MTTYKLKTGEAIETAPSQHPIGTTDRVAVIKDAWLTGVGTTDIEALASLSTVLRDMASEVELLVEAEMLRTPTTHTYELSESEKRIIDKLREPNIRAVVGLDHMGRRIYKSEGSDE